MMNNLNRLPYELIDMIADYHDYDKYSKPKHIEKYIHVINDIVCMSEIMDPISPKLALECWGPINNIDDYMVILPDEEELDVVDIDDLMVGLYEDDGDYALD